MLLHLHWPLLLVCCPYWLTCQVKQLPAPPPQPWVPPPLVQSDSFLSHETVNGNRKKAQGPETALCFICGLFTSKTEEPPFMWALLEVNSPADCFLRLQHGLPAGCNGSNLSAMSGKPCCAPLECIKTITGFSYSWPTLLGPPMLACLGQCKVQSVQSLLVFFVCPSLETKPKPNLAGTGTVHVANIPPPTLG